MARSRLSDDAITNALSDLPDWERRGDAITKTFTFPAFMDGIAFVDRIAESAEAMDHHPDIDIRYTRVTCTLSTHDAGGITDWDVRLAREIEQMGAGRKG